MSMFQVRINSFDDENSPLKM